MKKNIISISIITLVVLFSFEMVYAASMGQLFSGTISYTKAQSISDLENQGYTCQMDGGTSIKVTPKGQPKSSTSKNDYYIEAGNQSKTTFKERIKQLIMGRYRGTKTITCKKPCPPPPGNECISTATLEKIDIWGNSKQ